MSNEALELEARLKDYVSGELDKISNKLTGFQEKQKRGNDLLSQSTMGLKQSWNLAAIAAGSLVGTLGAMSIFNTVTGFMKKSREEALEFARAQAQLKTSLGGVSYALNEQAEAISRRLVIDSEEVTAIQTMISYFTKDEDAIKKLTKAALDFAAVTGGDGRSIARAIEGNSIELKRWGIEITESEGSLERIDEIANKVNVRFGEQAEAIAKTKDWWTRLKKDLDDTAEAFGRIFTKTVSPADAQYEKNKKILESRKQLMAADAQYGEEIIPQMISIEEYYGAVKMAEIELSVKMYEREMEQNKERQRSMTETARKEAELFGAGAIKKSEEREKQAEEDKRASEKRIEAVEREAERIARIQNDAAVAVLESKIALQAEQAAADEAEIKEYIRIGNEKKEIERSLREKEIDNIKSPAKRELAQFDLRREYDLKAFRGTEEQKKRLTNTYAKERARIEKENTLDAVSSGVAYSLDSLQMISRAIKASASVQKGLDIAMATANTAIGVTKAISKEEWWMIPIIIALGMAQVGVISQQKYASGGIVGGGSPAAGDVINASLTPGEMVLNGHQQANLFSQLNRPNVNNSAINLNISVGSGGSYDMNAARYTVDSLVPIIGDALVRAKNEGRLRAYETSR
jgi:hypothetical protein